jgi:hypothetical protein
MTKRRSIEEPAQMVPTRRLLLVPDTNYLMHGRAIDKLTPKVLGTKQNVVFVFVQTVIKEIDDKTHHPNTRYKRRAKKAQDRILAAYKTPSDRTLVFRAKPAFEALGLDPDDADDRVVGYALALAAAYPDDDVKILTIDGGMEIRALDHHVPLVEDAKRFRESDAEDETEKALRLTREELRKYAEARPKLAVRLKTPADGLLEVYPALADDVIATILGSKASPEPEASDEFLLSTMSMFAKKVENYDELIASYADRLSDFLRSYMDVLELHPFELIIENDGLVAATDAKITIFAPSFAEWLDELPKGPDAPEKPQRLSVPRGYGGWDFSGGFPTLPVLASFRPDLASFRPIDLVSPSRQVVSPRKLTFTRRTFPQRDVWAPDTVYLRVPLGSPKTFDIKYEVRIGNGFDVQSGALVVRTKARRKRALLEALWEAAGAGSSSE